MDLVETYRGPVGSDQLGVTLVHEHIFVRNFELEVNAPDPEWNPQSAVEQAVAELTALHRLGVGTVVDLTVPGLGRDVRLVAEVADRVPVNLVAATGWYTSNALPTFFKFHGPGRVVDRGDPLVEMFVGDIRDGIAGSAVRAGILKVMSDAEGMTPDVTRVMACAATAHLETGVTITTHSHPASRNGLEQQAFLESQGVPVDRIVVGHSGDSEDLEYLRELMDRGSMIGMDRFGMEHVLTDERRVRAVAALLEAGYVGQLVLSHDAAVYSHVTPPSWRAKAAPNWRFDRIPERIIPMLLDIGASEEEITRMMVENPRRLLVRAA